MCPIPKWSCPNGKPHGEKLAISKLACAITARLSAAANWIDREGNAFIPLIVVFKERLFKHGYNARHFITTGSPTNSPNRLISFSTTFFCVAFNSKNGSYCMTTSFALSVRFHVPTISPSSTIK